MEEAKTFEQFLTQRERSKSTIKNYLSDLRGFIAWFKETNKEPCTAQNITTIDLREYKRYLSHSMELKPNSINRKLATIRSYLSWAVQTKKIKHTLTIPKFLPKAKLGPHWLSKIKQNQLMRLVEKEGDVRNIAIVKLLLNTGLRVQELCTLRWQDISLSDRKGTLVVNHGKGEKRREVPLNRDAREALMSLGYGQFMNPEQLIFKGQRGPLTARGVQFLLKHYSSILKDRITPHNLRHSFCKNLINAGVGLEKVAVMAGHESLETTRRYCEPSLLDLQQAVDLIGEME